MNRAYGRFRVALVWGVFLSFALASVGTVFARTWQNKDGRTIEAEFVSLKGNKLTLNKSGKNITFDINLLIDEDQAAARALAQVSTPGSGESENPFAGSSTSSDPQPEPKPDKPSKPAKDDDDDDSPGGGKVSNTNRNWSDVLGNRVVGRFMGISGTSVSIKKRDRQVISVDYFKLVEEDKRFINNLLEKTGQANLIPKANAGNAGNAGNNTPAPGTPAPAGGGPFSSTPIPGGTPAPFSSTPIPGGGPSTPAPFNSTPNPGMPSSPGMPTPGIPSSPGMPGGGFPGMPSSPGTPGMPGGGMPGMPGGGMPGMPGGMPGSSGMPGSGMPGSSSMPGSGMPGMPGGAPSPFSSTPGPTSPGTPPDFGRIPEPPPFNPPPTPNFNPNFGAPVMVKICESCKKEVPDHMTAGDTCPHCKVVWDYDRTNGKSTPGGSIRTSRFVVKAVVAVIVLVVGAMGSFVAWLFGMNRDEAPRRSTW